MSDEKKLWVCPKCGTHNDYAYLDCKKCSYVWKDEDHPTVFNKGEIPPAAEPKRATPAPASGAPAASSQPASEEEAPSTDPFDRLFMPNSERSVAAAIMRALAALCFVGGLFAAYQPANITVTHGTYYTYTETQFSFSVYLTTYAYYFGAGLAAVCSAELFQHLKQIALDIRQIKDNLLKK